MRYAIGDRTAGIHYRDEGSLTLYLAPEKPTAPHQLANWLPTPDSQFRPIMRFYLPQNSVFQHDFSLSSIVKK